MPDLADATPRYASVDGWYPTVNRWYLSRGIFISCGYFLREERLFEGYPPLPLGFPEASRVIHAFGAHNEADFREYG